MRRAAVVLLVTGVAAGPALARDTNREGVPVGHRALGLAGAFTGVTGDPASLWYNPAGLGAVSAEAVSANATLYQYRTQTVEKYADFGVQGGSGDLEASDFVSVPASLVYTLPLGDPEDPHRTRHAIAAGLFVPDDDTYDARVEAQIVGTGGAAQIKASDARSERTYFAGGGYGYQSGALSLGGSAFLAATTMTRQSIVSLFADGIEQINAISIAQNLSTTDVLALAQVGLAYRFSDTFQVGVSVRSATFGPLYQSGELLVLNATDKPNPYVDRHETDEVEATHRRPARLAVGSVWRASPKLTVNVDLHYDLAQKKYTVLDVPTLRPRDARGEPLGAGEPNLEQRTLEMSIEQERSAVANGAVGVEYKATEKVVVRGGAWTDLTAVKDATPAEPLDFKANLFSAVLGLGLNGEKGSTDAGVLFRYGAGEADSGFGPSGADVKIMTVGLFLGGSANL